MHSFEILYVLQDVNIGRKKKGERKCQKCQKRRNLLKDFFKDSTRIGGRGMCKIKDDFYYLDIN
jgi:hypothetical protein